MGPINVFAFGAEIRENLVGSFAYINGRAMSIELSPEPLIHNLHD